MKKTDFNKGWTFARTDGTSLSSMFQQSTIIEQVTLPHDASVRTKRDATGSTPGNGFFKEENYVYTKLFSLDEQDQGKKVYIEFESVYQNAFVYVNNSFIGKHAYGYTPFVFDITDAVSFSEENEIKVVVRNGAASGRWYTGGGIYRNVRLWTGDRMHVAEHGVHLSTVELQEDMAVIQADVEIDYSGMGVKHVQLEVALLDAEGKAAAVNWMPVTLRENTRACYQRKLYVKKPKCWSADQPYLYTYRVRIMEQETCIDEECGSFGIRKLSLDPVNGLRVNGTKTLLRGGCIHHDYGILGSAEYKESALRKVRKLKEAGYNAIRSSHYPIGNAMLEACDELGMYVMDEFTDVWTSSKVIFDYSFSITEHWKEDVKAMVDKDYNHPCVIMYSIGNEIPEVGNRLDASWGKKFADEIKRLDPYRYTTNSINTLLAGMDVLIKMAKQSGAAAAMGKADENSQSGRPAEINSAMANMGDMMKMLTKNPAVSEAIAEGCEQVDVVGYNYAAARYEEEAKLNPNRILLGTETNPKDLDKNWELVEKLPNVIGDFAWTAWDYLGETGIGVITYDEEGSAMYAPYPYKAAYCGDINLIGDRRPISYWRQMIWEQTVKPYVCVQPPEHYGQKKNVNGWSRTDAIRSWNWEGYEGKPVVVEAYTCAGEAALYVNGQMIEKKKAGTEETGIVYFDTVYVPGTLEVAAYQDEKEVARDQIITAGETVRLDVKPDKTTLSANGEDISYIEISLVDDKGALHPGMVKNIRTETEGLELLGLGSGTYASEENYFDTDADTFEGRLLAVVKSRGSSGKGVIRFSADGVETVTAEYTLKD